MPRTSISRETRERARRLRREMTPQERAVWRDLRALNALRGCRFRRQAPIGPFIADFACFTTRLVLEIDGGQHLEDQGDRRRDAWLASRGFEVMRFWNSDVAANQEGLMAAVDMAIASKMRREDLK